MKLIKTTPKQKEAFKLAQQNSITLYGGAIRGGKSYWLILIIFSYALKYPNSRWAIIRATYTTLTKTLLITLNQMLNDGLDFFVLNKKNLSVTLKNGSEIFFFAENFNNDKDLNRFKGLEVNGFGFDEINECQHVTFIKAMERAGTWQHSKGCPSKIFATCNPANNWVKDEFYDKWKNNTLPEGFCYIPSKITDNPYLNTDFVEGLKRLPEHQYQVFVEGNWDYVSEGLLFPKSELNHYSTKEIEGITPDSTAVFTDVADQGKDYFCSVFGKIINEKVYIYDVIFSKLNTDITTKMLASKIIKDGVKFSHIETNSMGAKVFRDVKQATGIGTGSPACGNKETRLLTYSGHVINYFYFLNEAEQSQDYKAYYKQLTTHLIEGKNLNDDAPDATCGLSIFLQAKFKHLWEFNNLL